MKRLQNHNKRMIQEVGPTDNWVGYLKWLGVEVEGPPSRLMKEREEK